MLARVDDSALTRQLELPSGWTRKVAGMAFFLAGTWADHHGHFAIHLRDHALVPPTENSRSGR